ncbi:MAG: O-antigen ligase family protein [Verrucomicrobia bacterium]|nr:O-antigen ligase family protein [Verrucomicrobiota bacterium]
MIEIAVFFFMVLPGFILAVRGSSYLVDYTTFIFVFNRGIRRVVDYYNHQFNAFSLISITPLIMLALLFVGFLARFDLLHSRAKQIFLMLLAGIGYGFVIGITRNGAACIYQGAQYLSTIGLMGYVAVSPANDKTADRWLRSAALAGILAAFYGWYQYYTVPDWDAFWVRQVGFINYLGGELVSTKMWVFSTFAERGTCASYMGLVAISMLVSRRWRFAFGWPEAILILSCIFITFSRIGIVVAVVGIVLFPVLNGGKNLGRIVIVAALAIGVLFAFSDKIPGVDRMVKRFEILLHIQDDGSFQGRVFIAQTSWAYALSHPIGFGIGSSGMAARINGLQNGLVTDNGWIEIMTSLGLPGFVLFAGALALLWRYFALLRQLGVRDDYLGLARTFLVACLVFTWAGNFFIEFSVMWIAMGRALSPMMFEKIDPRFGEIEENEPVEAVSGLAHQ